MATLRSALPTDADQLFALVQQFPTPTTPTPQQFSEAFQAKLSQPSSCLLVVEEGERLVGYVSGDAHWTFYAGGQTAWVDELFVTEPHRRGGVGRQLMTAFEQWAQERRCVLVALATSGAVAFYQRCGYSSKAGYFKRYL